MLLPQMKRHTLSGSISSPHSSIADASYVSDTALSVPPVSPMRKLSSKLIPNPNFLYGHGTKLNDIKEKSSQLTLPSSTTDSSIVLPRHTPTPDFLREVVSSVPHLVLDPDGASYDGGDMVECDRDVSQHDTFSGETVNSNAIWPSRPYVTALSPTNSPPRPSSPAPAHFSFSPIRGAYQDVDAHPYGKDGSRLSRQRAHSEENKRPGIMDCRW